MNKDLDLGSILLLVLAFIIGYIIVSVVMSGVKRSKSKNPFDKSQTSGESTSNSSEEKDRRDKRQRWREEKANYKYSYNEDAKIKDEGYYKDVLGLSGKITLSEVRNRYRELVFQYHPDKVNHLGPKLREVAEQQMTEINEAFEYFKRRYE